MNLASRIRALDSGLVAAACLASVLLPPPGAWAGQGAQARDAFPNGCVDCHTSTAKGGDSRLSTLMSKWTAAVDPALLDKAKASVTDASKVKGKHPAVPKAAARALRRAA